MFQSGDYITWYSWGGFHPVARVETVSPHGYAVLMASDGFSEFHERIPRGAVLANPAEVAAFERIRAGRVAPIAYE
jgi:hypothetical protein